MYDQTLRHASLAAPRWLAGLVVVCLATLAVADEPVEAEFASSSSILRQISQQSERLELTTNSSRILTLGERIPRFQVNNPELLAVTALSANQIQISARKPGVTQVNLWDENKTIHTVDVIIYGDLRELEFALKTQFPNSSITVRRFSQSLVMTGFVDNPEHVSRIMRLAEDYAPKVIDNLNVGGVQQVLLKVKVFEVSRTKLRQLGFDFAALSGTGGYVGSGPSGLLGSITHNTGSIQTITDTGGSTLQFGIMADGQSVFGFLDALQQQNIAKILAEPNLVSVSGRPAQFLEGGEIPVLVPQSLGTTSIEYKPFGTQIDFLPIVLGNGRIRLEVRPQVSDIAPDIGVQLQNTTIPGFRTRRADTAVEMQAGQTFALAGLIQHRSEAINRGLPYLSDIPGIGIPFRRVQETTNEIELLIMVTPELVDAMEPHEVPQCLPGMGTMSPSNKELYYGGHLEVPNACSPCGEAACGRDKCCNTGGCTTCGNGVSVSPPIEHGVVSPQYAPVPAASAPSESPMYFDEGYDVSPADQGVPMHGELHMPPRPLSLPQPTPAEAIEPAGPAAIPTSPEARVPAPMPTARPGVYQPQLVRAPQRSEPPAVSPVANSANGLIGPTGYDLE